MVKYYNLYNNKLYIRASYPIIKYYNTKIQLKTARICRTFQKKRPKTIFFGLFRS